VVDPVTVVDPSALVGDPLALVVDPLALVVDPRALVRDPGPLVDPVVVGRRPGPPRLVGRAGPAARRRAVDVVVPRTAGGRSVWGGLVGHGAPRAFRRRWVTTGPVRHRDRGRA